MRSQGQPSSHELFPSWKEDTNSSGFQVQIHTREGLSHADRDDTGLLAMTLAPALAKERPPIEIMDSLSWSLSEGINHQGGAGDLPVGKGAFFNGLDISDTLAYGTGIGDHLGRDLEPGLLWDYRLSELVAQGSCARWVEMVSLRRPGVVARSSSSANPSASRWASSGRRRASRSTRKGTGAIRPGAATRAAMRTTSTGGSAEVRSSPVHGFQRGVVDTDVS